MTRRNSPGDIQTFADLRQLDQVVVDKRFGQRSSAKKNRRNRHYQNQFIRNALAQLGPGAWRDQDETGDVGEVGEGVKPLA